jgi:hypothetical protein
MAVDKLPPFSDFWANQAQNMLPITRESAKLSLKDFDSFESEMSGTLSSASRFIHQYMDWYPNKGEGREMGDLLSESQNVDREEFHEFVQQILTGSIFVSDIEKAITDLSNFYDIRIEALQGAFEIIIKEPQISDMRAVFIEMTTESKRIQSELGNCVGKLNGNLDLSKNIIEAKKCVIEANEFMASMKAVFKTASELLEEVLENNR